MAKLLKKIFAIDASDIPTELIDACSDIDDEFPLHCANGIVSIPNDGNPFSEWLKTKGFVFSKKTEFLAVWGT